MTERLRPFLPNEQPQEFKPPEEFTNLDGKVYHFGGQLRDPQNHLVLSFFYYRQVEGTSADHKIFRQQYITDVLALQAKNDRKPDQSI